MVFMPRLLSLQHAVVAQCHRLSESERSWDADVLLIFR